MTLEDLTRIHSELCNSARKLMEAKCQDYGADDDPFRNFRTFGALGILVRMSDKIARLQSYLEKGKFIVQNEGLEDTLMDTINYSVLFYAYLVEQAGEPPVGGEGE